MRGAARQLNGGAGAANGRSCGTTRTRSPPTNAAAAAMTSTGRQDSTGTAQRTRWGSAEPSVNAPTRTPIASPRPSRYHPATIFIPGGYTPASAAPVSIRSTIPVPGPGANATPRVARPASHAQPATSRRADPAVEVLGQCLDTHRLGGVVPRVEDVQLQLFGVEERVVGTLARDEGVEASGGGLRDHRARRPRHDPDAAHPLRAERHQARCLAHEGRQLALERVPRDVDLSPTADRHAVFLAEFAAR